MTSKIILLIEDNPSDIKLTKRALANNHILNDLVVIEDGQEALEYLFGTGPYENRDISQKPALILLDLKLPRIDGLEILQQIRTDPNTKRLPVVVLTTSKEEQDVAASYDLGVNSFIRKPVDFDQFVSAIQHLGLYWLVLNETPPDPKIK